MRSGKENGLILPQSSGTSGEVLVSNANGTLSWAVPLAVAGGPGQVQFYNASSATLDGAANAIIENDYLKVLSSLPSAASVAGGSVIGAKNLGNREMVAAVDVNGYDYTLQAHLGRNKTYIISPVANSTTPTFTGLASWTSSGATARQPASGTLMSSLTRVGFPTTTVLANLSYFRGPTLQWWRGNAAGQGGFHLTTTFGVTDTTANASKRLFLGLWASTSNPTNVEPTTMANVIGICKVSTSNNLQIISNAGSGTASLIDLGTNFPGTISTSAVYMLTLFAPSNGTSIGYRVDRLDASFTASGTISSNLPVNTQFLTYCGWVTNNSLAQLADLDLVNFYLETDT